MSVFANSQLEHTLQLFVQDCTVNRVEGVDVHPPLSPASADFSIMMECTPEIGHCHSMCTLWSLRRKRSREKFTGIADVIPVGIGSGFRKDCTMVRVINRCIVYSVHCK